jgi:hypothetical protein
MNTIKPLKLTLLLALAALAACDHKLTRKERIHYTNEFGNRYISAAAGYAEAGDTAALIADLETLKPFTLGTEGGTMLQRDLCLGGLSSGDLMALEKNDCRRLLAEHFADSAVDQTCGKPSELLEAYFASVSETDNTPEAIVLKDLAVARVECLPGLPDINIAPKARYGLLLRILQRQTGAQAGITRPEELRKKLAVWLWRAEK